MRHDPSRWTQKCVHAYSALVRSASGHICVPINVGKPSCLTVDADGRRHFPDHAAVSARVWRDAGGCEEVATLIEQDMDVHLLKAEGVEEFASRPHAIALLLTGLAEIHANAGLFGGISETSFKIKWKNLDKRGRAIMKAVSGREAMPMAA